jgi:hypothetical protein
MPNNESSSQKMNEITPMVEDSLIATTIEEMMMRKLSIRLMRRNGRTERNANAQDS